MSDAMRKDFHQKAEEKITPDSSKSTVDKTKEELTSAGDKVARETKPDSEKTHAQSISDKVGRTKDEHTGGESLMDKTKHALGMDKK